MKLRFRLNDDPVCQEMIEGDREVYRLTPVKQSPDVGDYVIVDDLMEVALSDNENPKEIRNLELNGTFLRKDLEEYIKLRYNYIYICRVKKVIPAGGKTYYVVEAEIGIPSSPIPMPYTGRVDYKFDFIITGESIVGYSKQKYLAFCKKESFDFKSKMLKKPKMKNN